MRANIKSERLFKELEEVAYRLFTEVRKEAGLFRTGVCQLKGKKVLFLNCRQSLEERITSLAAAISGQNIDEVYLKPTVRAEVEHQLENLSKTAEI